MSAGRGRLFRRASISADDAAAPAATPPPPAISSQPPPSQTAPAPPPARIPIIQEPTDHPSDSSYRPLSSGGPPSMISQYLRSQRPVAPTATPVIESGATIIRQSEDMRQMPSASHLRISPIEERPRSSSSPQEEQESVTTELSPIQRATEQSFIRPAPTLLVERQENRPTAAISSGGIRGRGKLIAQIPKPMLPTGGGISADAEQPSTSTPQRTSSVSSPSEEPSTQTTRDRLRSLQIEATQPKATDTIPPSIPPAVTTSRTQLSGSGGDSSSNKPSTQFLTIASSSSQTRALEELPVEHLIAETPVIRKGENGIKQPFATNYVKLKCKNSNLYQFRADFDPPVENVRNRHRLIRNDMVRDVIGSVYLFDGSVLFLPKLLDRITTLKDVPLNEHDKIKITLKLTKMLPPELIPQSVFNIMFKNMMKELKMSRIGQHYYSSVRKITVERHGLQIWPGYTTAIHEYQDGLYLVIDVAHKVLRVQTVLDSMYELYQRFSGDEFRQQVINSLIGNIVLTRYNNKTHKIDDIKWEDNPKTKFKLKNGEEISYIDYYKKQYGIEIKDFDQPLLINRPKEKKSLTGVSKSPENSTNFIALIPELCNLTGLSEAFRNDMNVKKDLQAHTRLSPNQRTDQLNMLIRQILDSPKALKFLKDWGLELDSHLVIIDEGRVVPKEKICFAKREIETDDKSDWQRACGQEMVLRGVDIVEWLCVFPANKEQVVEKFVALAMDSGRRLGINLSSPSIVSLANDKPDTYYNETKKALTSRTQMVMLIFSNVSDSRYGRVKKLCCVECPVPSQVVVVKTISKPDNVLRTVAQKIVLQMNCKMGGELWSVKMPMKNIMIVGIDVYHKTEKKQWQSIAGFVSSLNPEQTRWYSKVCFQANGQELTDTLKPAFINAIDNYQKVNNCLPEKIFIFRDGVSDGQLSYVAEHEVTQIRSFFGADYSPQICVIVVQKRINTRIFSQMSPQDYSNPKPGAVIDHRIVSKNLWDFFLVSQHVSQGTVSPTHYIVIFDDTKIKPDHIQRLCYKMTHMYYNWSGTIRVPAPCQYAHKLAFLTGQYIQADPATELCNRLFYL